MKIQCQILETQNSKLYNLKRLNKDYKIKIKRYRKKMGNKQKRDRLSEKCTDACKANLSGSILIYKTNRNINDIKSMATKILFCNDICFLLKCKNWH